MSRYRKISPVPVIAAVVLLAAFIGMIVWATGKEEEPVKPFRPVAREEPEPEPAPPLLEEPVEELPIAPPPKPKLTTAQAEKMLRRATAEWRAFTVRLCQERRWPTERAVAFLEKVTWNDRDREKQHAHGLQALRRMAGAPADDPVALAEALGGEDDLGTFFERNWSKVDVDWEPEKKKEETVLEDAWKPTRIRWGFPLDTPVETLQEFKVAKLRVARSAWRAVAGSYIQGLEIDDGRKETRFRAAVGDGVRQKEAKMQAAFRVLLDLPDGSIREVVEEFLKRAQEQGQEEFVRSLAQKLGAALEAAEKAG